MPTNDVAHAQQASCWRVKMQLECSVGTSNQQCFIEIFWGEFESDYSTNLSGAIQFIHSLCIPIRFRTGGSVPD